MPLRAIFRRARLPGRLPQWRECGFTLIELLIAVAVVGILAAIALPQYAEQVRRAPRAQAQAYVSDLASRQQQFLVDKRRYASSLAELGQSTPADLAAKFEISLDVVEGPPPSYTLTAKAVSDQAKDKCPLMTLDSAGTRTPAECW